MYELIGPVKKVEVYIVDYVMKDSEIEEGRRRPLREATFNKAGYFVERTSYDHTGSISTKYRHTHDAMGQNTGYEEYAAIIDKTLSTPRRHDYSLNSEGRMVEHTVYESDGSVGSRFVYKHDKRGNLIEDQWYAHTGRPGGRSTYTYDEKGNKTSQTNFDGDGKLNWKTVFKYDAVGNATESLQYRGETLRYKVISSYDSKGRLTETETVEFNSVPGYFESHALVPGKVIYTYSDENRTKEVADYDSGGKFKGKVIYSYDERGNEIGIARFGADGSNKKHEVHFYDNINVPGSTFRGSLLGRSLVRIDYDSHGNWTKKTHLIQSEENGPPQAYSAELRIINYY